MLGTAGGGGVHGGIVPCLGRDQLSAEMILGAPKRVSRDRSSGNRAGVEDFESWQVLPGKHSGAPLSRRDRYILRSAS